MHSPGSASRRIAAAVFFALVRLCASGACEAGAASPKDSVAHAKITHWRRVFRGVEYCKGQATQPRPLQMRAVRVDLREPGVRCLVTPSNGARPKDCDARKASEFLAEFKCQVAINGSFFGPFAKRKGDPQDVIGLSKSRGDQYSPPNQYAALLISKGNKAWIARSPIDASKAHNALAGNIVVLDKGKNVGGMGPRHPRTAVGISQDGRYLILMVIDGRRKGYSGGVADAETAEWLRKLGAWEGLNLDGGGSTTMVIQGRDGKPAVVNRPSGGAERRCPNHLGVFARHR